MIPAMQDDDASVRAELARWFIDHDEVDEAARVLRPRDELLAGKSDYLALLAALGRRGLAAEYDEARRTVFVSPGSGSSARRPPARAMGTPSVASSKKTA